MKLERAEIKKLAGVNRNKARGIDDIQPYLLYNLAFDRDGGYTPMGAINNFASLPGTLFGYDDLGYVTLIDGGKYRIFNGVTQVAQTAAAYAVPTKGAHIPGVGAYANKDQFCVFDKDGTKVEPFAYDVSMTSQTVTDEELLAVISPAAESIDQDRASGELLVVGLVGYVARSKDNGKTWTTVTTTGLGATNLSRVRRNNSCWIAFSTLGAVGDLWRSVDGIAWSQVTTGNQITDTDFAHLDHDNGIQWICTKGTSDLAMRSLNDGLTWSTKSVTAIEAGGMDYSEKNNLWFSTERSETSANSQTQNFTSVSGDEWLPMIVPSDTLWRGVKSNSAGHYILWGVTVGTGLSWIATSVDIGVTWPFGPSGEKGLPGFVQRIVSWGKLFFAWTPANAFYSETVTGWNRVKVTGVIKDAVVANSGDVIAVLGGSIYRFHTSKEMPSGQYEAYAITYVDTNAGKLVTHLKKTLFTFSQDRGNQLVFTAPANPTGSAHVFTEIYIKFAQRTIDENNEVVQVDLDTRDAILFKVLDPGDTETAEVAPELNRVLPAQGNVGTFGYDTLATVNGARVWAKPSVIESDYTFLGEDLDIKNFFAKNCLSFSELGYVNFGSVDNQERIGLGASVAITAISSTPSGLMVFGSNEALIISGDIATNDIAIARFPDIIGCDLGVKTAQFGGVTFVIWNGECYAIVGAQAQKVVREGWIREFPFVQVVADLERKDVILRSSNETEKLWRLDIDSQQVANNVITTADYVIPNPTGAKYITSGAMSEVVNIGSFPTPMIDYRELDYGDNTRRDHTRRIRVRVDNWVISGAAPRLYYDILDAHPDITTENAANFVLAQQLEEELIFTLPLGMHSRKASFRLKMIGMPSTATIEPNILIEFIPGKYYN